MILHEQFELEVLSALQSGRFLTDLIFGGGTMLRLCHGLDRYSVDLDFWVIKNMDWAKFYNRLEGYLRQSYTITDSVNKHFTLLFELKSPKYPRALKIEIRKETKKVRTETSIAYSPHSTTQVMVKTVALADMMKSKIESFLDRKEIRDAYDIEFLLKKGIPLEITGVLSSRILVALRELGKKDFSVKLGAIISAEQRKYYQENRFRILETALKERCA